MDYDTEKNAVTSHARAAEEQQFATNMSVGEYISTRISTLKPPMTKVPNPISLLAMLNKQQWLFFLVCAVSSNSFGRYIGVLL